MFSFDNKRPGEIDHKKDGPPTPNQMLDDYVYRYPPFPKGIPAASIGSVINSNEAMIQQIILARGLAGKHNATEVDIKILSPIHHLAEFVHLLPMSEKDHFRTPGGLFSFSLESALFGIRYAERRILTRVTPEIRRENEALWAHAAFLVGLFSEAILVISRIAVYSEEGGIEWHPGMESIFQWLERNNLKSYHLRWSEKEDRSMIYALAGKAIQTEQAEILAQGEKAIYKTLLSALHDQEDLNNPLVKINRSVKYKLIERDEAGDPSRYGKPLAGMHLDPWLIDAMRHLVEKKRWVVNEDNGRLWHGKDGVYLVWPLAASDMQRELKESESPFVPNTKEILAELMQEAGIIERIGISGGYLFDIAIPQTDNPERKYVTAIRLVRHEILFEKISYNPLAQNLQIHFEAEEEGQDQEPPRASVNKEPATASGQNAGYDDEEDDGYLMPSPTEEPALVSSVAEAEEETDMEILFGKPSKSGVTRRDENKKSSPSTKTEEARSGPRRTVEMELLFGSQAEPVENNPYDDDYASGYINANTDYAGLPEVVIAHLDDHAHSIVNQPEATVNTKGTALELMTDAPLFREVLEGSDNAKQKAAKKLTKAVKPIQNKVNLLNLPGEDILEVGDENRNTTSDLLSELMGTSKSRDGPTQSAGGTAKAGNNSDISKLFGNTKNQEKQSRQDQLKSRSDMVLGRLKKLPIEFLESRPGGITKISAQGLRNTRLTLKDCVSVLKAAELLVLVEGLETGADRSGEKQVQYFLVKADLLDGK